MQGSSSIASRHPLCCSKPGCPDMHDVSTAQPALLQQAAAFIAHCLEEADPAMAQVASETLSHRQVQLPTEPTPESQVQNQHQQPVPAPPSGFENLWCVLEQVETQSAVWPSLQSEGLRLVAAALMVVVGQDALHHSALHQLLSDFTDQLSGSGTGAGAAHAAASGAAPAPAQAAAAGGGSLAELLPLTAGALPLLPEQLLECARSGQPCSIHSGDEMGLELQLLTWAAHAAAGIGTRPERQQQQEEEQ